MNMYQKRKERKEKRENNSEEKVISSTGINCLSRIYGDYHLNPYKMGVFKNWDLACFNKKGRKYIQSIKENLQIPTKVNKDSKIFNYELKASLLYDLINNTDTYSYEIKNKPESK